MRYTIDDIEFDGTSLVLNQNGEPVDVRHNEAKVLLLLLENADRVISKEEILTNVWQDKVVSEQAVFQTISNLRVLFGQQAIKTFPKRGYQWQRSFKESSLQNTVEQQPQGNADHDEAVAPIEKGTFSLGLVSGFVALVLLIGFFMFKGESSHKVGKQSVAIAYIPFTANDPTRLVKLEDTSGIDFTALTQYTNNAFSLVKEVEYPKLIEKHPLVLTANVRQHQNAFYLNFSLKGPAYNWTGQLTADSQAKLISALVEHISHTEIIDLLLSAKPLEVRQAALMVLHQQHPDDLNILMHLINTFVSMADRERAFVLAEKLETLATAQQNELQKGNALLLQSEILSFKDIDELSGIKLDAALASFEAVNDLALQSDIFYNMSVLSLKQKEYPQVVENLLKASDLAKQAGDIPRELEALTYLSVLAHKFKKMDDRYHYLQMAEQKMEEYQLAKYHFAKVPFHYAIFAHTEAAKVPHYKQVLEFTQATPDHWVAVSSRQRLMEYFIAQNQLQEAQTIVDGLVTDTPENTFLRALLAKANNLEPVWRQHAKRAFEQAQLAGKTTISLDAALMLCSEPLQQENFDFYSQYIQENAPAYWREKHEEMLTNLNI